MLTTNTTKTTDEQRRKNLNEMKRQHQAHKQAVRKWTSEHWCNPMEQALKGVKLG